jgi:hypothetical protein
MRLIYLFLFSILMAIALGCATQKQSKTEVVEPQKPQWVLERPIDRNFFIGIARVSKSLYPNNFVNEARKLALAEMASEIQVDVSSQSMLFSLEDASGRFSDEYKSFTRLNTNAQLENFEIVGQYENSQEYWVFYRLSKQQYAIDKQKKINHALDASKGFFSHSQQLKSEGNIEQALISLFKAFKPVKPHLSESLSTEYEGNNVFWGNHLSKELAEILSRVEIQAVNNKAIEVYLGQKVLGLFDVKLVRNAKPVTNLPVLFSYSESIIRPRSSYTNAQGIAICNLDMIRSANAQQRISAKIDIRTLYEKSEESPDKLLMDLFENISVPTLQMNIQCREPKVWVDVVMLDGKNQSDVKANIERALITRRYAIANQAKQADLILKFNGHLSDEGERNGRFQTIAGGDLSLIYANTKEVVFNQLIESIRGIQLNQSDANKAALNRLGEHMNDQVVPRMHRTWLK